jgi:hypothetical protein
MQGMDRQSATCHALACGVDLTSGRWGSQQFAVKARQHRSHERNYTICTMRASVQTLCPQKGNVEAGPQVTPARWGLWALRRRHATGLRCPEDPANGPTPERPPHSPSSQGRHSLLSTLLPLLSSAMLTNTACDVLGH